MLSEEQLKEIEAWVGLAKEYQSDEHPLTDAARNIDALCQTVRALRADVETWRKSNEAVRSAESVRNSQLLDEITALRDQLAQATTAIEQRAGKYCDRPEDMPLTAVVHAAFNVLESKLAQVQKERDAAREMVTMMTTEKQRAEQNATTVRSQCVETIRNLRPSATGAGAFKDAAIKALESLPLEQVEQEKQS